MKPAREIKAEVRQHYARIAEEARTRPAQQSSACCAPESAGCGCSDSDAALETLMSYSDEDLRQLPEGADLGLGCGNPVAFAGIRTGDTILDLGSGAGIDVFIAARQAGPGGHVIGVDMTEAMVATARKNAAKIEATNVEFRLGEIEALPVEDESVDMIISNCVINLVPDKAKAFSEMFRVLKPGGRFSVSDIVTDGEVSDQRRADLSLWAGCVSGAVDRNVYLDVIVKTGFRDVAIVAERKDNFRLGDAEFASVTVSGKKP
jgi:arsenite methyltransferase